MKSIRPTKTSAPPARRGGSSLLARARTWTTATVKCTGCAAVRRVVGAALDRVAPKR